MRTALTATDEPAADRKLSANGSTAIIMAKLPDAMTARRRINDCTIADLGAVDDIRVETTIFSIVYRARWRGNSPYSNLIDNSTVTDYLAKASQMRLVW